MEICHSPELILRAYESLIAEAERSAAFRSLAAGTRPAQLQSKRQKLFSGGVPRSAFGKAI